MPQIAPGVWKSASSFFWFRLFDDGREEFEFDPRTGNPAEWGKETPSGIKRFGWLPMTPELADKIRDYDEIGYPVSAPPVAINVQPGEVPVIYKDPSVIKGLQITCSKCKTAIRAMAVPETCPRCGQSLETAEVKGIMWDDVVYGIGIEGRYELKFNARYITVE